MKTKKNSAEVLGSVFQLIGISGFVIFVAVLLITVLHKSNGPLDVIGVIGAIMFMIPFFSIQFLMPSGILKKIKVDNVPFWGKLVFYLFLFPVVNMWMLSAFNAAFSFLPEYRLGFVGGDMELAKAMYHEFLVRSWTIIGIAYFGLLGLGVLFRNVFKNWLQPVVA
jgi:hypothetical protein